MIPVPSLPSIPSLTDYVQARDALFEILSRFSARAVQDDLTVTVDSPLMVSGTDPGGTRVVGVAGPVTLKSPLTIALDPSAIDLGGFVTLQTGPPPGTPDTGNANIDGTMTAGEFDGPLVGDVTGNVTGDLTGNVAYEQTDAFGMLATDGAVNVQTALTDIDSIMYASAEPHGLEMTSYKTPVETTISYVAGTRTFSIAPKSPNTTFHVYIQGKRYTLSSTQSVTHAATEGVWFFYFDSSGVLVASQTAWTLRAVCPVALIYWDATNATNIAFAEERHGLTMDSATHQYLHSTVGTRYVSGLTFADYTLSSNGAITGSLTDGVVRDEDIEISITHAASPGTNQFEQVLRTANKALIPIYYRSGASGVWRKIAANASGYLADGPGANNRHFWNEFTAGAWQKTQNTSGDFSAMWVYATDDVNEPVIIVMGQRKDGTIASARANNLIESLVFGTLPHAEFKVLYRLIFGASGGAAWPTAIQLQDVQDLRSVSNLPSGTYTATSHAALTNLDYDHAGHTGFAAAATTLAGYGITDALGLHATADAALVANALKNATGTVDVASAAAPGGAGYLLTSTGATAATWQSPVPSITRGRAFSLGTQSKSNAPTIPFGGGSSSPLTTKGDLYGFTSTNARRSVGADGTFLGADSADTTGLSYQYPGIGTLRTLKETIFAGITPASFANGTTTTVDGSGYTCSLPSANGTVDIVAAGLQLRRNTIGAGEVDFVINPGNTGDFNSIMGEDRFRRGRWALWVRLASYNYTNASANVFGGINTTITYPKWGVTLRRAKNLNGAPNTATGGIGAGHWFNGAEPSMPSYPGVSTADVWMAYFRTPEIVDFYYGTYSAGWPLMSAMLFMGSLTMQTTAWVSNSGTTLAAANVAILFNLGGSGATSGTYEIVIDRWRLTTWE